MLVHTRGGERRRFDRDVTANRERWADEPKDGEEALEPTERPSPFVCSVKKGTFSNFRKEAKEKMHGGRGPGRTLPPPGSARPPAFPFGP